MDIVIVEDELAAVENLKMTLTEINPNHRVIAEIRSVKEGKDFFRHPPSADVIISDIRLSDGHSFDIFKEAKTTIPIIFTTAFDQFAIEAFNYYSVGYVLKPIKYEALKASMGKLSLLKAQPIPLGLSSLFNQTNEAYLSTLLAQKRDKLIPLTVDQIKLFQVNEGAIWAVTSNHGEMAMSGTMEYFESKLNPNLFFRANRQVLLNKSFVKEVTLHWSGKLMIDIDQYKISVSKERAPAFKLWLAK